MNLVVDIGNTSLKYSSNTDIGIKKVRQLKYSKKKPTFIIKFLKNQFKTHKLIYICSVVSEIDKIIKENLKRISDLSLREKFCLYPLVLLIVIFGIYPKPILETYGATVADYVLKLN